MYEILRYWPDWDIKHFEGEKRVHGYNALHDGEEKGSVGEPW